MSKELIERLRLMSADTYGNDAADALESLEVARMAAISRLCEAEVACATACQERDALAAELKALRARAIELEAETKSSEEMQTLKFCEREWSTERAAMMNTIHALRNCGDAHPIHARELTDETIQRYWDEACKDTQQAPGWSRHIRFARAIERYLKGVSENG